MKFDRHIVCGCGGVGIRLIPELVKLSDNVLLIDGDTVEPKNLDRQFFEEEDIGKNKAEALAKKHNCAFIPEYYIRYMPGLEVEVTDLIWCCVDNHTGRREILETCDAVGCSCIIGANEYTDAEAYFYEPSDKDTENDPRVFYPNINIDVADNPLRPEGCTGVVAQLNPQLGLANNWACSMMLQLFWFHTKKRPEMPSDTRNLWPVHHRVSIYGVGTTKQGERSNVNKK
jgi:molybdopterin/thiamine biosynthesis adenylyltransferase